MNEENPVVNPTEATPVETVQDVKIEQPESSSVDLKQHEEVVPYSRLKEKVDEANYYKEIALKLAERREQGETKQQIEEDPYAGMDPDVAQWQRQQDKRVQSMILREAQKLAEPLQRKLEATNMYVSQLIEKDFRSQNTDVIPNSAEEKEIAHLIGLGVKPQRASWAVMGEKRLEREQTKKQEVQQIKIQQKAQANLETSGISSHSGIPKGEKLTFRQQLERNADAMGIPK